MVWSIPIREHKCIAKNNFVGEGINSTAAVEMKSK